METFYQTKFSSYEDFDKKFTEFKEEAFLITFIRTSRKINVYDPSSKLFVYEYVLFMCKHGLKSCTNQADGSRPNQQSYFTGCKYSASLCFDRANNCLYFGSVETKHNHPVCSEAFDSYTTVKTSKLKRNKPVQKLLKTLISSQTSVYHQAIALNNGFGLKLTHKDLHNFKRKIDPLYECTDQASALYKELKILNSNDPDSVKIFLWLLTKTVTEYQLLIHS